MREMLANIMVIALSIGLLWHFGCIIKYKQFYIQEPNILILVSEIAMFCAFIAFAIFNIIKLLRSK